MAVYPSSIYLTFGDNGGQSSTLPARIQIPLQAGQPKPHPFLRPDGNQEEELQTNAHETQHQEVTKGASVRVGD